MKHNRRPVLPGIGIAQEDMEKLIQPFVQLDRRLSQQYEGSDLGLALVHRLTTMHGGATLDNGHRQTKLGS